MTADLELMREITRRLYVVRVVGIHGEIGETALVRLLEGTHQVHRHLPYELVEEITVVASLEPDAYALDPARSVEVRPADLPHMIETRATIEVRSDGRFLLAHDPAIDPGSLAGTALIYRFSGADLIYLDGDFEEIPNPTGYPSAFGIPTFFDLNQVIQEYRDHLVRQSTCRILRDCWLDDRRLLLANRPERFMRRSLENHLRSALRQHDLVEIRPEQIVDETHPIDIKVTWTMSNRLALIEIKWMGASVNAQSSAISTNFSQGRALEGARQLADYLDANVQQAPSHLTMGFLVVYDARRRGITFEQGIDRDDARAYVASEIDWDPEYHAIRRDFATPVRMFMEPREPAA